MKYSVSIFFSTCRTQSFASIWLHDVVGENVENSNAPWSEISSSPAVVHCVNVCPMMIYSFKLSKSHECKIYKAFSCSTFSFSTFNNYLFIVMNSCVCIGESECKVQTKTCFILPGR
jgi:hypothetical protein